MVRRGVSFQHHGQRRPGSVQCRRQLAQDGGGTHHIAEALPIAASIDDQSGTLDISGTSPKQRRHEGGGRGSLILEGAVTGTAQCRSANDGSSVFGSGVSPARPSPSTAAGLVKIDDPTNFPGTIREFQCHDQRHPIWSGGSRPSRHFFSRTAPVVSDGSRTPIFISAGPTFGFNVDYDNAGARALITRAMSRCPQRRRAQRALLPSAWRLGVPSNAQLRSRFAINFDRHARSQSGGDQYRQRHAISHHAPVSPRWRQHVPRSVRGSAATSHR